MLNLSLNELNLIAKYRGTKGYKRMSKNKLLSIIKASEPIKNLKPSEIKEKKTLMLIKYSKTQKIFLSQKIKIRDIRKEHYDADEILRDTENLFDSDEEDYYKPIRIGNAFSSSYIEYKSNGDRDKTLSIKQYLDEIKPYLNDFIDGLKTKGEWKIKLTMAINFFSSKDSN